MTDALTRAAKAHCRTCGGTGRQLLFRSWFVPDGWRRERCGICAGTGKSTYRDDARFIRKQAALRSRDPVLIADAFGVSIDAAVRGIGKSQTPTTSETGNA